jgi:hypothetical protein
MAPKPPSKWLWCLFHVDSSTSTKRKSRRGVFIVWFDKTVSFHENLWHHLAKNSLFSARLQFGAFSGMSIPPPIQRENSPRRIVSCVIQHYCLFSRKKHVSFGHKLALFCAHWADCDFCSWMTLFYYGALRWQFGSAAISLAYTFAI